MRIDVHTHILPERWPDLKERYGYGGFVRLEHDGTGCARMMKDDVCFRTVGPNCWDPRVRIDECGAAGVDVQVLSTVPVMFSYWARPEHALDLARLLNDHIASVVRDHPSHFVGLGTLPLQDPELAIGELERCLGELGLAGVEIGTHVNGRNLDDPALFPVLERAAELGAALFVHPWEMLGGDRMKKYWLSWLVAMPAETTLAVASLIFGGVLERLPDLRVAFAHGGGAIAFLIGRIAHGFHVRPDLCAVDNDVDPRLYMSRIFVDSHVCDPAALRLLLETVGAERVALGSDYPFPLGEQPPGRMVEAMEDLDPATREMIFCTTPLAFLGLDRHSFATA